MLEGLSRMVPSSLGGLDTGTEVLADSKFQLYNRKAMASHMSGTSGRARGFRRGTLYMWSQAELALLILVTGWNTAPRLVRHTTFPSASS